MSISKIMAFVFGIAFIVFLYGIIYYSLKIMYKDVKTGGKKKSNPAARKYAVEVVNPGASGRGFCDFSQNRVNNR